MRSSYFLYLFCVLLLLCSSVQVVSALDADFTAIPTSGNVPLTVQFTIIPTLPWLEADFIATPMSGSAPLTVQFTDTSYSHPDHWSWDFGDNTTSTDQNPIHTYTKSGDKKVELTTTDRWGNTDLSNPRLHAYSQISVYVPPSSVDSITPDTVPLTTETVAVTVRGKNFPENAAFELVGSDYYTIHCLPNTITRVSDTTLTGKMSFVNAREGLYDVVLTSPAYPICILKKGFRVSPVPVVLIHGIKSDMGMWDALTPVLDKEGIPYWNFNYDTRVDPTASAVQLDAFIKEKRSTYWKELYPDGYTGKIDIVCHSMGAIVSRWYMEPNRHGNEVRQWIGIAPAHGGSAGADLLSDDDPFIGLKNPEYVSLIKLYFGPDSLKQLQTTSNAVQYLKTDPLASSTTYRVIAGWNPSHSLSFGNFILHTTRAKNSDGSAYWTYNGDMIIAQAQSYREGMGFECFPTNDGTVEGGNNESAYSFDHTHIHHSPAVIQRVIKYLKNPDLPLAQNKPVDQSVEVSY